MCNKRNPFNDPNSGWYEVLTCFKFWQGLIFNFQSGMQIQIFWGRLNASHKSLTKEKP